MDMEVCMHALVAAAATVERCASVFWGAVLICIVSLICRNSFLFFFVFDGCVRRFSIPAG